MTTPTGTAGSVADLLAAMQPDPEQPDGTTSTWQLGEFTEGTLETGVWEATVGGWDEDDYPVEEFIVMLSGHLRLTEPDGTVHDLRRGDVFHLPKGWAGRWDVVEDMQKIYAVVS